MARTPDPRIGEAKTLYLKGLKLTEVAAQLGLPEGTVRRWKCTHKWDNERSDKNSERSDRKKGGQPGNKNATGPPGNRNAEKYGFFSKYLPEETREIFSTIERADPLELLWHQIQIAYAAIVRAQRIAYVKDQQDKTIEKVENKSGNVIGEKWEVQQAWDKQNEFLKAQARAQGELRALIKQYDEMLHKDWNLATEEQRTRIEVMKAKAQLGDQEEIADDGFLEALKGTAAEDWISEED
ncbi:MAG TPA: terminase [Lachnospiraceae bacterium]|nr:terminase [Lachnospiraceae bacterium]